MSENEAEAAANRALAERYYARLFTAPTRPILWMGADRKMVLFTGMVAAILVFETFTWPAVATGVVLWLCGLFILRHIAKKDPLMRQVYMRHLQYGKYYAPTPTPFVQPSTRTRLRMRASPWNRNLD